MAKNNRTIRASREIGSLCLATGAVLRNLCAILVERGILTEEDFTELGLRSLHDCAVGAGRASPDLAAIDFVWALLDRTGRHHDDGAAGESAGMRREKTHLRLVGGCRSDADG